MFFGVFFQNMNPSSFEQNVNDFWNKFETTLQQ